VAETVDNLRFHHAESSRTKLRTYPSFAYQAGSWTRPRKVVARLECSLQPDVGLRRHFAQGHRTHSATANQVRLALHTAAFWLMHCVRSAIPETNPLARCEFATLRERLIKIGARVIEHIARIRVQLPTSARREHCSAPSRLA
jgi:hypothetical protein